ncbi:claudin-19-like isoform X1 [Melopsittacus undulatus]|uniref:claudin-19-like isoform X1 n=1 Tax=Melopsittacus undulatus TaxID=13146 RepID=UPI00146AC00F|nr:claudin-19-like isoform X1 [Melopsittacus undulatus]
MPPPQGWGVCVGLALAALGWALLVASLPHSVWGLGGGRRRPWPRSPSPAAYGATASPTPVGSAPVCPSCPSSHCLGSRALAVVSSLVAVPGLILGGVPGARRSSRTAGGAIVLLAGLLSLAAAVWFAVAISQEFFDPQHAGVRFEPGPGVLQAGGGGAMAAVGGALVMAFARDPPRSRGSPSPAASLGDKYVRNAYV